ncbi:arginase [bacterium SCSIO 12741]|nr:arginase [bacterium SCSIO 12741]
MSQIKIIINRSELGAGTRGSSLGADALEISAINRKEGFFNQFPVAEVEHNNRLLYQEDETPDAHYLEGIIEVHERLEKEITISLRDDRMPVVLSGDHSNAAGTIAALKKNIGSKRLGVIWVDAHGDLHSPYTSPSGNVHGMPLAISLAADNKAHGEKSPGTRTVRLWNDAKGLHGIEPKILPEDLVMFAVRSTEKPEDELMKEKGIKNYSVPELRYRGIRTCLDEAFEKLKDCDWIYLSFDVDAMDSLMVSEGTGTPVEKGLDPDETRELLSTIVKETKLLCMEFVEINPLLDNKGNHMADVAFDLLKDLTQLITDSPD